MISSSRARVSSERALVARHRLASHACMHACTHDEDTHIIVIIILHTHTKKQTTKERANTERMEKKRAEDEDGPMDGRDQKKEDALVAFRVLL